MGDYLPFLNFPTGIVIEQLVAGEWNNMIIDQGTSNLYIWGDNTFGALGFIAVDFEFEYSSSLYVNNLFQCLLFF